MPGIVADARAAVLNKTATRQPRSTTRVALKPAARGADALGVRQ